MKQLVKKLIALLLASALLFSLVTAVSAHGGLELHFHEEAEENYSEGQVMPQATCTHNYIYSSTEYVYHGGVYISSTICKVQVRQHYRCANCGMTTYNQTYITQQSHVNELISSSCTGTVQTWGYSCRYCGGALPSETRACPGAPHVGKTCNWLPI